MASCYKQYSQALSHFEKHMKTAEKFFDPTLASFPGQKPSTVSNKSVKHAMRLADTIETIIILDDDWMKLGAEDKQEKEKRRTFLLSKENIFDACLEGIGKLIDLNVRSAEIIKIDPSLNEKDAREVMLPLQASLQIKSCDYELLSIRHRKKQIGKKMERGNLAVMLEETNVLVAKMRIVPNEHVDADESLRLQGLLDRAAKLQRGLKKNLDKLSE